jgi:hypothetical protein
MGLLRRVVKYLYPIQQKVFLSENWICINYCTYPVIKLTLQNLDQIAEACNECSRWRYYKPITQCIKQRTEFKNIDHYKKKYVRLMVMKEVIASRDCRCAAKQTLNAGKLL